ncbi:MAG: hydrogenase nickel incorporation protein HypB [Verrucomicrobiota bacterium]
MQEPPVEKTRLAEPVHEHEHEHVDANGHRYTHIHGHSHEAGEAHEHGHSHPHEAAVQTVPIHLPLLAKNDRLAERNRGFLSAKGIFAINVVSSPGSGKTTFLAKTLELLGNDLPAAVIVGDLETANDAARLRDKGAPVVQVTTGTVCHLDAEMVARGLEQLDLKGRRLLIIENVGNLVCPASYDLGEAMRVVLISVTEGEDKPLKYPPIFRGAKVVVISKTDLTAATGFDLAAVRRNIQAVAPEAVILEVSAKTGEGMQEWIALLGKILPVSVLSPDEQATEWAKALGVY